MKNTSKSKALLLTLTTFKGGGRHFGSFNCFLLFANFSAENWYAWNEYFICQQHNDYLLAVCCNNNDFFFSSLETCKESICVHHKIDSQDL